MWIFFGGPVITQLDYIQGYFLCILESFIKAKVQNWGYYLGLVKFQIFFLGCLKFLEIPDISFRVDGDVGPEPTYEEKK